jgi:sortase B
MMKASNSGVAGNAGAGGGQPPQGGAPAGPATVAAIRVIRVANGAVDLAVLILILLVLTIGAYSMWDAEQVYNSASATQYEKYKPTVEDGGLSFEELQKLNPEVFSWLTVYGTHIDYPVVQSEDNTKYVNTDAYGNYSMTGAIFLDSGSSKDFSDFNSILYGHHMEKEAMFGEIGLFADQSYFDERKYGALYYDGVEHGLEFFAFLRADAYDSEVFRTKVSDEDAAGYLAMLLDRAERTRDIGVTTDDRIVLLSTCTAGPETNGRDILVGRITDEVFPDAFLTIDTPRTPGGALPDRLKSLWELLPLWAWGAIGAGILAFIIIGARKRRAKKKAAKEAAEAEAAGAGGADGAPGASETGGAGVLGETDTVEVAKDTTTV